MVTWLKVIWYITSPTFSQLHSRTCSALERPVVWPAMPQCCYMANGAKRPSRITNTLSSSTTFVEF